MPQPKKPRRDLYAEVTQTIIDALEKGVVPWRNPMLLSGTAGLPRSLARGKPYRGVNVFLLSIAAWSLGYDNPYWLTYRQAQARGGQVKAGEKSQLVVFWKLLEKTDPETGEVKKLPVLRHYRVFNARQCEGLDVPEPVQAAERPNEPIERAEAIVAGYPDPPEIAVSLGRAFYRPSADVVCLPAIGLFRSSETYYATLFHELGHSTGHSKRLDRGLDTELRPFGSPDYSREELVAEMTAAFLCAEAGLSPVTIGDSASYCQGWLQQIRGEPRLLIQAAGAAQKAADHVLNRRFDQRDAEAD